MKRSIEFILAVVGMIALAGTVGAAGRPAGYGSNRGYNPVAANNGTTSSATSSLTPGRGEANRLSGNGRENTSTEATSTSTSTPSAEGLAHRSAVANAVQELLSVAGRVGGIGQQISVIAREQGQNQTQLENAVQNVQSRNPVLKFLIGPNYGEIKNAQNLISQNQRQIDELNQLRARVTNQTDQQKIADQISVLGQSNQQLNASLNQASNGFSLLGWLFKLIVK